MTASRSAPRGGERLAVELLLLGLLALLWGSSYLFLKLAVASIPPITLIAARVLIAAGFLMAVLGWRRERLPRDARTWRMLLVQSFFGCFGAWTLLAWGQQYIDSGLASVLNSISPIFVFLFTLLVTRHEALPVSKLLGAGLGLTGVILIVGVDALAGLGQQVAGQLAALGGAMLYGCAAIYGRRFAHITPASAAAGAMIWASAVLVPASLVFERPWTLAPSNEALLATGALAVLCTGCALLIYFRLVRTLGSLGVASQAYLRAGVGVVLGMVFLGERLTPLVALGLAAAILGVALINWPRRGR